MGSLKSAADLFARAPPSLCNSVHSPPRAHPPRASCSRFAWTLTKEELAEAVVERRLEEFRAARAEWDRLSSPKERLLAFVGSVQANREQLARGGCAFGGLCTEL